MKCRHDFEHQEEGAIKPLLLKNTDTLRKKVQSKKKRYDYYPFGLTFNSFKRSESTLNKFKFQGQEHIDDLGLNWDSFKWRNHQPDIGRFFNIDPLADSYVYNSPYAFSENKVVAHIELEGLESFDIKKSRILNAATQSNVGVHVRSANKRISVPVNLNGSGQVYGAGGRVKVNGVMEFSARGSFGKLSGSTSGAAEFNVINTEFAATVLNFGVKARGVVGQEKYSINNLEITEQNSIDGSLDYGMITKTSSTTTGTNELASFSMKAGPADVGLSITDEDANFDVLGFANDTVDAIGAFFRNIITDASNNAFGTDSQNRTQDEYVQDKYSND